jgi:two-component system probable response regulator PhcQ
MSAHTAGTPFPEQKGHPMNRIMILDDEPNVTSALQRVLKRHWPKGLQIEVFNDPISALLRAETTAFDVILSDFRMPEMDGLVFLQAARTLQPGAVRMILSASTELDTVLKAINDAEAFRYLTKPWQEDVLIRQIHEALRVHEGQLEDRRLADDMRMQRGTLSPQAREMKLLEEMEPGITQVNWGPDGEVLMPPLQAD